MCRKLNRKGFTLIELLAVIVILVAIMGIAIPSISSSLERTKGRQNEARYKIIETAAEEYVTDYKNSVYDRLGTDTSCYLKIGNLGEYLSDDEMTDADGNDLTSKYVIFTKPNNYRYSDTQEVAKSCN